MKPTRQWYDLGQRLWLDNISRELPDNDTLLRHSDALALQLQQDRAQSFVKSWQQLLQRIADKSAALASPI